MLHLEILDKMGVKLTTNPRGPLPMSMQNGEGGIYFPQEDSIYLGEKAGNETLWHEAAHATGHHSRLNRATIKDGGIYNPHLTREEYCKEEIIAWLVTEEMCYIAGDHLKDYYEYLNFWIERAKKFDFDYYFIRQEAEVAVDYLTRIWESTQEYNYNYMAWISDPDSPLSVNGPTI